MTAKEAIEILKEEHDYAQLPSYVNQALGMAITALEDNEIYKQVNFLIASQRDERDKTIEELEKELEKYTTEKLKEIELREMGYSEEYINIKRELEASWPKWKINAYNDYFAISPYAKKLRGEYK